jgi:hypothetical protein
MQQLAYFESTPEHRTNADLSEMPLFQRFEIGYFMRMRKNYDFYRSHKDNSSAYSLNTLIDETFTLLC